jgi:microcystin-dependent protein
MSDPYIGEIRMFAGDFAPNGWLRCDGSLVRISDYDTLFALIGTTYGGDGQSTFALPDLRGRIAVGRSSARPVGYAAGVESVTLTTAQMPQHSHRAQASTAAASTTSPNGSTWAASSATPYTRRTPLAGMSPTAVSSAGGSQPHSNMPPYLAVHHIIAVQGIFPTQD